MGHPTLSSEQIRLRNNVILAYADQHPEATNVALGLRFGMSPQAISVACIEADDWHGVTND